MERLSAFFHVGYKIEVFFDVMTVCIKQNT